MEEKKKKSKIDFKEKKENTVRSLFEVEHFLHDLKNVKKGIDFYRFFKH